MGRYVCGNSVLRLTGRTDDPILPGTTFDYDFSAEGPEGVHGPAREAALVAAGAILTPAEMSPPPLVKVSVAAPSGNPNSTERLPSRPSTTE